MVGASPAERAWPRERLRGLAGLGIWAVLIGVAAVWGVQILHRFPQSRIFAPPLVAMWRPGAEPWLFVPVGVAGIVLVFGPKAAASLRWRALLWTAVVAAAAWAYAVSIGEGLDGPTRPLRHANDYIHDVALIAGPGDFLTTFTEEIDRYHQHVRAHPPGFVLLLWGMDRAGLGGVGWEAALVVLGGAASVPAAMVALREVAGESRARFAAAFLAFGPAAVYVASTADAFFAGVTAWAVALVVVATGRADRRGDALALGGGLAFGAAAFLSYGMVLLAAVPLVVAIARRRISPLVFASVGVFLTVAAFATAGFWWVSGLAATLHQYGVSVARFRPYGYFVLGNLAAFAVTVGPAGAAGLSSLRNRRTWLLVGAALGVVAVVDLSGMSKGEVERIWLPFVPWVLLATSALVSNPLRNARPEPSRAWLGGNLVVTLALETLLHNTW
jgi:hypothetical protein